MRNATAAVIAGLLWVPMLQASELQGPQATSPKAPPAKEHKHDDATCTTCGNRTFGTSLEWVETPSEAAKQAAKEQKLVFVLHVSGHFEDDGFT